MPDAATFQPIGVIRSGHTDPGQTPIQPVFAEGCEGRAVILPEFADGLDGLEGFSHIYLLYHLHRAGPMRLRVKPFLMDVELGVFATRAPARPNAIGLSIVKLIRREGNVLFLGGVDILDGTPLLDIKPYTARFDRVDGTRNGWQDDLDDEAEIAARGRRQHSGS
jgi:tRNA-Thr(GGU) m(6)t(6)A37 methyltransferase TsaA